ncbi:MAG: mycothiol synthase [Actinobacteria bacterium]|nr:mycothiol synthase [Actinomycetota bacterium]
MDEERLPRIRRLMPEDVSGVMAMLSEITEMKGQLPLAEEKWRELQDSTLNADSQSGYFSFLAEDPSPPEGIHGYLHVRKSRSRWEIALVVHPSHAKTVKETGRILLEQATTEIIEQGGGEVQLWITDPGPSEDGLAGQFHLEPSRDLYQMGKVLATEVSTTLPTRSFRPGHDEKLWLELNNRAFPSHPEQSNWTLIELLQREAEEWFDPHGFLLYEADDRLQGACWTKIHREVDPPVGEIYVLSVDPAYQGHGLGRALLQEGLAWLQRSGMRKVILYVDGSNLPAFELYRKNGFLIEHVTKVYRGFLVPEGSEEKDSEGRS